MRKTFVPPVTYSERMMQRVLSVLLLLTLCRADPGQLRESVVLKSVEPKTSYLGFGYNTNSRTERRDTDVKYKKISLLPFVKTGLTSYDDKLVNVVDDGGRKRLEEDNGRPYASVPLNFHPPVHVVPKTTPEQETSTVSIYRFLNTTRRTTTEATPVTKRFTTTTTERVIRSSPSQLKDLFNKLSTPFKRHTTEHPDQYRALPPVEKENPRPIQRTRVKNNDGADEQQPGDLPKVKQAGFDERLKDVLEEIRKEKEGEKEVGKHRNLFTTEPPIQRNPEEEKRNNPFPFGTEKDERTSNENNGNREQGGGRNRDHSEDLNSLKTREKQEEKLAIQRAPLNWQRPEKLDTTNDENLDITEKPQTHSGFKRRPADADNNNDVHSGGKTGLEEFRKELTDDQERTKERNGGPGREKSRYKGNGQERYQAENDSPNDPTFSSPQPSSTSRPVREDSNNYDDLDAADIHPALKALLRSLDGQSPFQGGNKPVKSGTTPLSPNRPPSIPMVNIKPKGMHGMQVPSFSPDSPATFSRDPSFSDTFTQAPPRIYTPPSLEYYPPSPRMHLPRPEESQPFDHEREDDRFYQQEKKIALEPDYPSHDFQRGTLSSQNERPSLLALEHTPIVHENRVQRPDFPVKRIPNRDRDDFSAGTASVSGQRTPVEQATQDKRHPPVPGLEQALPSAHHDRRPNFPEESIPNKDRDDYPDVAFSSFRQNTPVVHEDSSFSKQRDKEHPSLLGLEQVFPAVHVDNDESSNFPSERIQDENWQDLSGGFVSGFRQRPPNEQVHQDDTSFSKQRENLEKEQAAYFSHPRERPSEVKKEDYSRNEELRSQVSEVSSQREQVQPPTLKSYPASKKRFPATQEAYPIYITANTDYDLPVRADPSLQSYSQVKTKTWGHTIPEDYNPRSTHSDHMQAFEKQAGHALEHQDSYRDSSRIFSPALNEQPESGIASVVSFEKRPSVQFRSQAESIARKEYEATREPILLKPGPQRPKTGTVITQTVGAELGRGSSSSVRYRAPVITYVTNNYHGGGSEPRYETRPKSHYKHRINGNKTLGLRKPEEELKRKTIEVFNSPTNDDHFRRSIIDEASEEDLFRNTKRSEPLVFADSAWRPDDPAEVPNTRLEDDILEAFSQLGPRKEQSFTSSSIKDRPLPRRQFLLNGVAGEAQIPLIENQEVSDGETDPRDPTIEAELRTQQSKDLRPDFPTRQFLINSESEEERVIEQLLTLPIGESEPFSGARLPSRQFSVNVDELPQPEFLEPEEDRGRFPARQKENDEKFPTRQYFLNSAGAGQEKIVQDGNSELARQATRQYSLNPPEQNQQQLRISNSRLNKEKSPTRQYFISQSQANEEELFPKTPTRQYILQEASELEEPRFPTKEYVLNPDIETGEIKESPVETVEIGTVKTNRNPSRQYSVNEKVSVTQKQKQTLTRQYALSKPSPDIQLNRGQPEKLVPTRQYILSRPTNEEEELEQLRVESLQLDRGQPENPVPTRQYILSKPNNEEEELEQLRVESLQLDRGQPENLVPTRQYILSRPNNEEEELEQLRVESLPVDQQETEVDGGARQTQQEEKEKKPPVVTSHFVMFPRPKSPKLELTPEFSSSEDSQLVTLDNVQEFQENKNFSQVQQPDIPSVPVREIIIVTPRPDIGLIRTEPPSFIFVEKKVNADGVYLESIRRPDPGSYKRNKQPSTLLRLPNLDGIDGPVTLVLHDIRELRNRTEDFQPPEIQTLAPSLHISNQVTTLAPASFSKVYFTPVPPFSTATEQPYDLRGEAQPGQDWRPINLQNPPTSQRPTSPPTLPPPPQTQTPSLQTVNFQALPSPPPPLQPATNLPLRPSPLIYQGPVVFPQSHPQDSGQRQVLPLANHHGVAKLNGNVVTKPSKVKYGYPKSKQKPFSEVPLTPPIGWKGQPNWKGTVESVKPSKLTKMVDLYSPNLIRPSRTVTSKEPDFIKKIKPRNSNDDSNPPIKLRVPVPANYTADVHKFIGKPGKDYPVYDTPPVTNFQCSRTIGSGLIADKKTQCQVFHKCEGSALAASFVCPKGTIYDQHTGICDWWYDVRNCGV